MSDEKDFSRLPLGLLLGRISGRLGDSLLDRCPEAGGDVRVIGLALAIQSNPGAAQADYARFLGIDLNTASRLVARAEAAGFLRKLPSLLDRRAHVLVLTDAGQALVARGRAAVWQVQADLSAQIGPEDMAAFRRVAERMLAVLAQEGRADLP